MSEDINSLFWIKEAFNGAKIREYSKEEGVNPRDFEKQIWAYDTLFILKEFSGMDLFFKGGTCIQSLLPFNFQRFSIDLDFNIKTEHRTAEFLLKCFNELNNKLEKENLLTPAAITKHESRSSGNVIYEKFYPLYSDEISGTVTFARVFMSKTAARNTKLVYRDDLTRKNHLDGIYNHILVQVNIKHEPPALKWEIRDIKLKIGKYLEYKKEMKFKCLSLGDLFADKLIAFRNRKAFKDLYDLGMMTKIIHERDIEVCSEKINSLPGNETLIPDVVKLVETSLKNKEYEKYLRALPREAVPLIRDRIFYTRLIEVIEGNLIK